MNKHICVREAYDWIDIGDEEDQLTKCEAEKLTKYLNDRKDDFPCGVIKDEHNRLKLINYVGIISIENVTIEIIPKISLSNDKKKDKEILLQMLSKCSKLPFDIDNSINTNLAEYDFIELLAKFFVQKLQREINKGIYREYINKEENLNFIKGKLLLSSHIKRNHVNKVKAYCSYDEYSENNFLNLVFKTACNVILRKINDDEIKNNVKRAISCLSDVDLIYLDKNKLLKYEFNRQNNRFKESYELAKLILLNTSMENNLGGDNAFSMLFEMNTLYEEYIGNMVEGIWNNSYRRTKLQDNSKYLVKNLYTERGNFNLKPDMVLSDEKEDFEIIIDTKWKSAESNVESADMYQMYAYVTRYEKARSCILLYPYHNEDYYRDWGLYNEVDKKIAVRVVRLESVDATIEDLKSILDEFS